MKFLITAALAGTATAAGLLPDMNAPFEVQKRADNQTSFNGPYSTKGRDIVNSKGDKVTWAGVNWPMSGMS